MKHVFVHETQRQAVYEFIRHQMGWTPVTVRPVSDDAREMQGFEHGVFVYLTPSNTRIPPHVFEMAKVRAFTIMQIDTCYEGFRP